jgi:crotonobetainyl-CoA:carnitine CoA-transferase CaiB-like acyl-CoA transferase
MSHVIYPFFAGYGQTGPYREAAGYDVTIEGEAGLMHMLVLHLIVAATLF